MTTEKIDFSAEGLVAPAEAEEAGVPAPPDAEDLTEYINKVLLGLQDSIGSMQIGLRIMTTRISGLEKFVAYLLEKDPVMGPKLKAQADREEEAAKKAGASGVNAPADGTQG